MSEKHECPHCGKELGDISLYKHLKDECPEYEGEPKFVIDHDVVKKVLGKVNKLAEY